MKVDMKVYTCKQSVLIYNAISDWLNPLPYSPGRVKTRYSWNIKNNSLPASNLNSLTTWKVSLSHRPNTQFSPNKRIERNNVCYFFTEVWKWPFFMTSFNSQGSGVFYNSVSISVFIYITSSKLLIFTFWKSFIKMTIANSFNTL